MTTTVIVKAHCASNKEVHIDVLGDPCLKHLNEQGHQIIALQDGETHELVVYDAKSVSVYEVVKD